jgi:hypothetical protein
MKRKQGPYFVDGDMCNPTEEGVIEYNTPPKDQPSLWCNFAPTKDGTAIVWTENEKTREGDNWIKYLIKHFLKPKAKTHNVESQLFKDFTYDHVCNGELFAQGEDPNDRWKIVVKNNVVKVKHGRVVFDD